jgi:cold shock protein
LKVTERHTGTVKWYDGVDGGRHFGFIACDDGSKDVFVHKSAVEDAGLKGLNKDDRVQFSIEKDSKTNRPKACDLRLI